MDEFQRKRWKILYRIYTTPTRPVVEHVSISYTNAETSILVRYYGILSQNEIRSGYLGIGLENNAPS